MSKLALGFAAGVGWVYVGLPVWPLPPLLALLLWLPIGTSEGPGRGLARGRFVATAAVAAGFLAALTGSGTTRGACADPQAGRSVELVGRFIARPATGSAPFELDSGCATYTVVIDAPDAPAGRLVTVSGRWRRGARGFWFQGERVAPRSPDAEEDALRWRAVRWRDGLVSRIERLYGPRAPLVAALTLARREGFDPELRAAFARTGLAHLLAISGFHVGVIAGLLLAALRAMGAAKRKARLWAVVGTWAYVGLIGFPDAACRAGLILAFGAVASWRGVPTARWGPLAAAALLLLVLDPARLSAPGFQLSFAGAAGLIAWTGPLDRAIRRATGERVPVMLTSPVAAGVSATVATLPIVAWHFEEVSVIGVPGTLVAGPMVALALPGALASMALDFVSTDAALFVAGGVDLLLGALVRGTTAVASQPGAAVWTTRPTVVAGVIGVMAAHVASRRPWVGGRARRWLTLVYAGSAVVVWPVWVEWQGRGTARMVVIDVGQGDAIALRGPTGRWVLVDAGPPGRVPNEGAHPVVRALRARGVRALDALVLTHADLDHIGGAAAVLSAFDVGVVYDPGMAAGKGAFVDLLEIAGRRGVPWVAARSGDRIDLEGLRLEVLSPSDSLVAAGVEGNEASVVLIARYGTFEALLTGDAYKPIERALASSLPGDIEVLKVGHHGSDTSTDAALLEKTRPELALISVGRGNRYGHPDPRVLERLDRFGLEIRRTDLEGDLEVLVHPDGRYRVRTPGR